MESLQNRPYTFDRVIRMILTLLVFGGLIFLISRLSHVLGPFFLAVFLAYLLNPLVTFIQNKLRLKRGLAVIISLIIVTASITTILWLLIPAFIQEMSKMAGLIKAYVQSANYKDILPGNIEETIKDFFRELSIVEYFQVENLTKIAQKILPQFWRFFSGSLNVAFGIIGFLIVFLYTIFILIDFNELGKKWPGLVPLKYRPTFVELINDLKDAMNIYFRAQGLIALIVGILLALGFKLIGLPLAITTGLFIGLLNIVPYLQIVGLIPALLLALLKAMDTNESFWHIALLVLIVLAVVQIIQETILTPRILGKAYGLNPAIVLLSLSIWGSLLGLLGMLLALPLTTLIHSYYKRFILNENLIITETNQTKDPIPEE